MGNKREDRGAGRGAGEGCEPEPPPCPRPGCDGFGDPVVESDSSITVECYECGHIWKVDSAMELLDPNPEEEGMCAHGYPPGECYECDYIEGAPSEATGTNF